MMSERTRIGIFIALLLAGALTLIVRLFSISVLQHEAYIAKAKEQQNVERDILPRRGAVYVQDGTAAHTTIVAQSVERFALAVTPRNVTHKEEYATLLAEESGQNREELFAKIDKNGWYLDPIVHDLTKDRVVEISQKISTLAQKLGERRSETKVNFDNTQGDVIYFVGGTYFVREYQRTYPEGALMGQLLGFVNDKGKGQYGFEAQYDNELRGYIGRLRLEQDSTGKLLRQSGTVEGKDGTSYELSIDRNIQYIVEQELELEIKNAEALGGSAIVMNPKTGEVVAMASYPSYNPNDFRTVAKDNASAFDNPAISNVWEPGSIFKPLVMAAGLNENLFTPETKGTYGASVVVDGYTINTALNKSYGEETMTQVLEKSDNVAMVSIANQLGSDTFFKYLQSYGFGTVTGVDLKNEVAGRVLPLQQWRNIHRATMSFGQGISVTPIQIATAYSAIANGGKMVRPRVVKAVISASGERQEVPAFEGAQVMRPEVSKQVRDMLVSVVIQEHKRAGVGGYKIGGKTGTAQVPDSVNGGYIENAYNHSFVGLGPSDDPQFVLLVKVDQPNIAKTGLYAEGTAVPLFGRIAKFLLHYYQIKPTNR